MGVTDFSLQLLNKHNLLKSGNSMLELGCQNLYDSQHYMQVARPYFEGLGMKVVSIDLEGCQGAEVEDLTKPFDRGQFDLVTDFGTTEHVAPSGLWQARKNVHQACKVGGVMVHENPKTGNWAGHGNHYMTEQFYIDLATFHQYEILNLGEHPAMGNAVDGWNIYCVMRKMAELPFVEQEFFDKFEYYST